MDNEKFNAVLGYFDDLSIDVPVAVKNAIEDVFMENDSIDNVLCYHSEDIDNFEADLKMSNMSRCSLDGENWGEIYNVWTYYGEVEYSRSIDNLIVDENGNAIEEICKVMNDDLTKILNKKDYVLSLIEKITWDTRESKELKRELNLYIYCPEKFENET